MRFAYFDCFSGASGDMILGACLDAGLPLDALRAALGKLNMAGYTLAASKVRKQGFAATSFQVDVDPQADKPHRHLKHVRQIIEESSLSDAVKQRAIRIFTRLAEAEAAAHGTTLEHVHFHEVGAIDAIVDVVGACVAMDALGIDEVRCSPIPTGHGTVTCEHGVLPVPAPGTAALLKGVPLAECDEPGELTTPTGAAILTTLATAYCAMPAMTIECVGYGAGHREGKTRPNVLRLFIGRGEGPSEADEVAVIEANVDDSTPEAIGYALEKLLAAGALDAFATPIYMKKNRPAVTVSVLAEPARQQELEAILFAETTTFGIRSYRAGRRKLDRSHVEVDTSHGRIRLKVGRRDGKVVTVSPEFDDCRAAAERAGVPLREVMAAALRAMPPEVP
jgi:uncharacterized protein (TIGR00299 family) protein